MLTTENKASKQSRKHEALRQPVTGQQRVHVLDQLRGFALLGLPFVNVLGLWIMLTPETERDFWIQRALYFFVEGRFYSIFSFLFGLGFYLFLSRQSSGGKSRVTLYIRRLLILLVLGLVHQYYNSGEALLPYAIVGLLAVPLYRVPRKINLFLGVLGTVTAAVLGFKLLSIPFLIILGLAAGQYRLIEGAANGLRALNKVWAISLAGTLIGIGVMWWIAPSEAMPPFVYYTEGESIPSVMLASITLTHVGLAIAPIVSLFYVSSILMLNRSKTGARLLHPLQAFGRMALTNYVGQTALLLAYQQMVSGDTQAAYTTSTAVCLGIVVLQVLASNLWMRWFQFGPLEWLWRCGTYGTMVPIRRKGEPQ